LTGPRSRYIREFFLEMIQKMCRAERIIDDAKMQEAFRDGAVDLVLDHPAARAPAFPRRPGPSC
jgi:hypothetical protein